MGTDKIPHCYLQQTFKASAVHVSCEDAVADETIVIGGMWGNTHPPISPKQICAIHFVRDGYGRKGKMRCNEGILATKRWNFPRIRSPGRICRSCVLLWCSISLGWLSKAKWFCSWPEGDCVRWAEGRARPDFA